MSGSSPDKPDTSEPVGVIHGRFQVLHNDHIVYLEAGRALCDHLVVGITNPDPDLTGFDRADPERSTPAANPFTFYERYRMTSAALLELGWAPTEFSVVPFPINKPELYRYYVPIDAVFYLTIYDSWGERKLEMFKSMGLRTHVLWRKKAEEKGLSSTDIRDRIAEGRDWVHLVPPAIARIMNETGLLERILHSG
jgi:nicotinamide-nucleotide adenylyltransferase